MAQPGIVKHISPMLAAADMDETVTFYQQVLGFRLIMLSPSYSILERDGQTIHISAPATEDMLASMRQHTSIYLEVVGITAMWQQVKAFAGQHKTREPFDREYGMTEFHIIDPNGCLVFVGEVTGVSKMPQP